jgi:hypothetical protein
MYQVNNFNYLGCDLSFIKDDDINNKLSKFWYICHTIQKTFGHKTKKGDMAEAIQTTDTKLTYRSETWTLTKREQNYIQIAEIKFLKPVAGYYKKT